MKEFITGAIKDIDVDQVIITRMKNVEGVTSNRVRANVAVTIINKLDPTDTHLINIAINMTDKELKLDKEVTVMQSVILNEAKIRIKDAIRL